MRSSLTTTLVAVLFTACSASPPEDTPDLGMGPDAGVTEDDVDTKPTLSIDALPSTTPHDSVPVSGTGPSRGTVIIETPTSSVASDIGSDGTFCVDVPLQAGIENVLWFEAVDENGNHSDEIERRIRQEGEVPDGEVEPTMRNIARLGRILQDDITVETGMAEFIADGDKNTFARLQNHAFNDPDWVGIELTDSDAPIDHIRVIGTDACPLENYYVMLSEAAEPGIPSIFAGGESWQQVGHVVDGAVTQTIIPPLGTKPKARYIALSYLGFGCGTFVGNNEIKEVEVWTVEAGGPTGPDGPSCASGGAQ